MKTFKTLKTLKINKKIKDSFLSLADNLKRISTWVGILMLFAGYEIYKDKSLFHHFLENMINNEGLMTIIIGTISGFLLGHRPKK